MTKLQDGEYEGIYVISNTNKPNSLDYAVTRRHDIWLEVPFPKEEEIIVFMKDYLKPISNLADHDYKKLASLCKDCSFYEIQKMITKVVKTKPLEDQKAEWFRPRKDGTFVASTSSDPHAKKMPYDKVPVGKLRGYKVTFSDLEPQFLSPIKACQTTHDEEINRFKKKYPDIFKNKDQQ